MPKQTRTLGPKVTSWIEKYLVYGDHSDFSGQQFLLRDWQKSLLNEMFVVDDNGLLIKRRALILTGKGNGKSELTSAICNFFFLSGYHKSPLVVLGAGNLDQAGILFNTCKAQLSQGPLKSFVRMTDRRIVMGDGSPGELRRVASSRDQLDGIRPTFVALDEIATFITPAQERSRLVLTNGLAKRSNTFELNISTPGGSETDLMGRMISYAEDVDKGNIEDETFYHKFYRADPKLDLTNPDELKKAIQQANPGADDFWPSDNLIRRYKEIPEHEFRRYHLGQIAKSTDAWLPPGIWQDLEKHSGIEEGADIILGFDGSYNNDSTCLVACTLEEIPRIEVVGLWEKSYHDENWIVPRDEVSATVRQTFEKYNVLELSADPPGWHKALDEWQDEFPGKIVFYETNFRKRMIRATSKFYTAVVNKDIMHDGNPDLERHLDNCYLKETVTGAYITKEKKSSPRKIDLAVGSVIAYDRATARRDNESDEVGDFGFISI